MTKLLKIFLVAFFLLVVTLNVDAQFIKGALIFGTNISQIDGDEVYGFKKIGFNIGASAIVPFSNKWAISIENIYSQKGAYQKPQYADSISGEYRIKLNYVEVPVLVHYTDKNIFTVGAGLSWGRLVKVDEWEHGNKTNTSLSSGTYSQNDINILADLRFRIWKKLKFNVRYAYSIPKIRTREHSDLSGDTWIRKQYNNLVSFRLIYVFNERQSFVNRNEQK
jgi:hypothetical protein